MRLLATIFHNQQNCDHWLSRSPPLPLQQTNQLTQIALCILKLSFLLVGSSPHSVQTNRSIFDIFKQGRISRRPKSQENIKTSRTKALKSTFDPIVNKEHLVGLRHPAFLGGNVWKMMKMIRRIHRWDLHRSICVVSLQFQICDYIIYFKWKFNADINRDISIHYLLWGLYLQLTIDNLFKEISCLFFPPCF